MWRSDWVILAHFEGHRLPLGLRIQGPAWWGGGEGAGPWAESCWPLVCRALRTGNVVGCVKELSEEMHSSLLSSQTQSNSINTSHLSLPAAPFCFATALPAILPSHSPCSQMASLQPIITIVICLKCRLDPITLQLKIVQRLPLPPSTQDKVHFLDPDLPLCCFNSSQPLSLIC